MKRLALSVLTIGLLAGAASAQTSNRPVIQLTNTGNLAATTNRQAVPGRMPAPAKTDFSKIFKSDKERDSYALGMNWGSGLKARLKKDDVDLDIQAFAKGFVDNLGDGASLITEAQEKEIIGIFNSEMKAKQEAKVLRNKADGEAFLVKNKSMPNVVTLPDGMQYIILNEGKGESPKPEDEVTVNYRGTLIDGTEFDSSFKRNQPLTTHVQGGVIPGWTEALQLMKPGSKWKIFIPPALAYGSRGRPPIGPNSTLIFEIELVAVKHPNPANPAPPSLIPPPPTSTPPPPPAGAVPPSPNIAHAAPPARPVVNTPLTSDIIKVPSQEDMKKGAKIETIKAEDLEKEKAKAGQTNQPPQSN